MRRFLVALILAALTSVGLGAVTGLSPASAAPCANDSYVQCFNTNTWISSGPRLVAPGSQPSFSVRVTAPGGNVAPEGRITARFAKIGGGHTATVSRTLSGGTASFTGPVFRAGRYTMTVRYVSTNPRFGDSQRSRVINSREFNSNVWVRKPGKYTKPRGKRAWFNVRVGGEAGAVPQGRLNIRVKRIGGGQAYFMNTRLNAAGIGAFKTRPFAQRGRYKVVIRFVPAAGSGFERSVKTKFFTVR